MAALAPDCLAFDDTPDGERLCRFDLASGRGLARSLGELRAAAPRRHAWSVVRCQFLGPLSVVRRPLSCAAERSTENATNEPNESRENVPNELTRSRKRDERTHRRGEMVTNEPTDGLMKRDERTHRRA